MAFQVKNFVSVAASMINYMKATQNKVTDFNVGSVARTLIEAPAIEIDELYQQIFIGLREAIPVATYQSFGFINRPAVKAFGYVIVSSLVPLASSVDVPAGTIFTSAAGNKYLSESAQTFAAGATTIRIAVWAEVAGAAWNAGVGVINQCDLFASVTGASISNEVISNGKDVELEADKKTRFIEYIASLSSGTEQAIYYSSKYAVVGDEYVTRIGMDSGGGRVRVFLYSSRGLPSAPLITAAQMAADGYYDTSGNLIAGSRSAGIRVDVLPMVETSVPMTAQVAMLPGFAITSDTINLLRDQYAFAIAIVTSGSVLVIDTIVEKLLTVPNVLKVVLLVNANIQCGVNEALIPGTLTVEPLNV